MDVKRLKVLIAKQQLTIAALATKAGVSADVIYKTLAGKRTPNLATVGKIAAALGVDPSELIQED